MVMLLLALGTVSLLLAPLLGSVTVTLTETADVDVMHMLTTTVVLALALALARAGAGAGAGAVAVAVAAAAVAVSLSLSLSMRKHPKTSLRSPFGQPSKAGYHLDSLNQGENEQASKLDNINKTCG